MKAGFKGSYTPFVYRFENVFKTDTTIFTTVAGLLISLRDGDEGSWNKKSYLSEECILVVLSKASIPRALMYKAGGRFRIFFS